MRKLLLTAFLLSLAAVAPAEMSVFREPGAAYLGDLFNKPLRLKVLSAVEIFSDPAMSRSLGVLAEGQMVEVQAVLDETLRVVGKARQGQVSGWIAAAKVEKLDPDFVAKLKQAAQRKAQVDALIEKNDVAIGMTPDEVTKSLGKPPKTTQRQDATGIHLVWDYVRYDRVPQQTTGYDAAGRYVGTTIYIKVPVGRLNISFENGVVSAVEQSEGTIQPGYRVTVLAPPIIVQ